MRLHRFYINQKIQGGKLRIEDSELLNQWARVFRLTAGDKAIIFDGSGFEYEAEFELLTRKEAILIIIGEKKEIARSEIELHVFQSIIKKDNFELVVQKCTELGVSAFHPIISERSEKKDLNIERLVKIATEASEQSGRGEVPEIFEPTELSFAVKNFEGKIFAFDFEAKNISEKISNLKNSKKLGIFIGPEGGWGESDLKIFGDNKVEVFSLGKQVLRAETASIVASTLFLI